MQTLCAKCGLACEEAEYRVHVLNDCQTVKCPKCPQHYPNEESLLRHTRAIHDKAFTCSICQMDYSSKYNLKRHQALTHKQIDDDKTYKCDCGELFLGKYYLERHIQRVHKKEFICTLCEHECISAYTLKKHIKRSHTNQRPSDVRVKCPKCERLIAKMSLERHIRSKHTKTFTCHVCERECHSEKALEKHISRRHAEENSEEWLFRKKFKCPQCPQRFTTGWNLKMHISAKHNREFICELCDKYFSGYFPLNRHKTNVHGLQIDTNEGKEVLSKKKFKCPQCSLRYTQNWTLKLHIKGKHEQKYKCELCDKLFSAPFPLARHKTNVHGPNKKSDTVQSNSQTSELDYDLKKDFEISIEESSSSHLIQIEEDCKQNLKSFKKSK